MKTFTERAREAHRDYDSRDISPDQFDAALDSLFAEADACKTERDALLRYYRAETKVIRAIADGQFGATLARLVDARNEAEDAIPDELKGGPSDD